MYAVIESGGKQYRVELGSEIRVDRLDVQTGDSITLDRVLLVANGEETAVGRPIVDGASVSATVLGQDRGDKIVVFKYKPKARTRVKKGFRAELTTLRIADIAFGGKSAAEDAKSSESRKAEAARDAEKAAAEKAAGDQALAAKLAAASEEPAASEESAASEEPAAAAVPKARPRAKAAEAAAADAAPEGGPTDQAAEPTDQAAEQLVDTAEAAARAESAAEAETKKDE